MARGFDSKSVEEQQAAFVAKSNEPRATPMTAEQSERNRQRELLKLSRTQVSAQLEAATSPRHREMLEMALADLDAKLEGFGPES